MASHGSGQPDPNELRQLSTAGLARVFAAAGVIVLAVTMLLMPLGLQDARSFWLAYVHNYAFFLSLSLGALFFVLLQHLTRAGWSVVVRRPAEIMSANLLVLAVLFVPIAVVTAGGSGVIYPWAKPLEAFGAAHPADHASHAAHAANEADRVTADSIGDDQVVLAAATEHDKSSPLAASPDDAHAEHGQKGQNAHHGDHAKHGDHANHGDHAAHAAHEALILAKRGYLNTPFFMIRWVVYFVAWIWIGWWFWNRSVRQDDSGDVTLTKSMQGWSAPAMVVFALTATFASFDLLMSLDPVWFSTIFGVYYFAGAVIGFFAVMIAIFAGLQKRGVLTASVTAEHYHDLGKLLFGFVFFWGYIAFSQYMLIWYGNIPEETGWFIRRGCATQLPNVWSYVIVLLLVGHFLVPFGMLLSRHVKRRREMLLFWAVWMLVLHWIDLYWLVMPELTTDYLPLGAAQFGCLIGLGLMYLAGLAWFASGRSLLPVGDPRLGEALAFKNV